ncbi:hypothetical protein BJ878DRAFT_424835 [Calycina marina]|uniref:AMP-dependent synthetase/ligase domain-containing protein n=1 Tax=Calycina marina TaxID=1763456 RepID=A0A9P8CDN8_9HELO|nr:hypothetical protein BJ878DRAFT_424835 [Calycina marina]
MGASDNFLAKLDQTVTDVIGQWDIYTTLILLACVTLFAYNVLTSRDPDAHPMLLARQAQASLVRQSGESAVFRSHSAPHGIPLNSGLNVKDPGDSKWARGRDGDLRDVWHTARFGRVDRDGKETGEVGKLLTVLGSEKVIEHNHSEITRDINLIGQHIKQNGGSRVAIYLPNSVEFLTTLFACAYYDLTAILVQYNPSQTIEELASFLKKSNADTVVAAVGSFPFDAMIKKHSALKQLIWVVEEGSKHLDWNEVPRGTGGPVNVLTWQDVLQELLEVAVTELPATDRSTELKKVLAFWPSGELVEYTQQNLIAGIASQLTSIPTIQRITPADLFLPVDSLTTIHPLVLTLAALYSNASVALNSTAFGSPNLTLATQGIAPTIVVVSPAILLNTHLETVDKLNSSLYRAVHWFQTRSMVQQGVMPLSSIFSRFYDSKRPTIGTMPGKLRLVYTSAQVGEEKAPLSAEVLSDLRIFLGARTIYALTAPKVAGPVTQTSLYDYRVGDGSEKYSHFGAPVTSVEILLKDSGKLKTTDTESAGEIVARGPAVVGGEAALGITGKMNIDHTLGLL